MWYMVYGYDDNLTNRVYSHFLFFNEPSKMDIINNLMTNFKLSDEWVDSFEEFDYQSGEIFFSHTFDNFFVTISYIDPIKNGRA